MMISTHRAVVFSHSPIEMLSCLNFAFKMYPDHLVESVWGPLISFDLLDNRGPPFRGKIGVSIE